MPCAKVNRFVACNRKLENYWKIEVSYCVILKYCFLMLYVFGVLKYYCRIA